MKECLSCKYVNNRCKRTSPEKVLVHFTCELYEEVESPAEVQARRDIITKFGEMGIAALLFANSQKEG